MGFRWPKTKAMLRREAANWLARLQSGRDPDVERKFQMWRDADPRHAAAFDRVRRSYEQAGLLRHSADVAVDKPDPLVRHAERRHRPALAAAAGIVLLAGATIVLVRAGSFGMTKAVMLATRVGEIRSVSLADGSKLTLDTATEVEVEIGPAQRSAHLRSGRVRVHIVRADRPFVVETGSTTVSAREGVIDVEQGTGHDRVQVLAGIADVRGSHQQGGAYVALGAGQGAIVDSSRAELTNRAAQTSDWTHGMLQFDGTPIAEAVALANRYSERRIVVAGQLEGLRVTGAFRAGDTAGLARALAAAFGLSLTQRADGNLLLARSTSAPVQNKSGG